MMAKIHFPNVHMWQVADEHFKRIKMVQYNFFDIVQEHCQAGHRAGLSSFANSWIVIIKG